MINLSDNSFAMCACTFEIGKTNSHFEVTFGTDRKCTVMDVTQVKKPNYCLPFLSVLLSIVFACLTFSAFLEN